MLVQFVGVDAHIDPLGAFINQGRRDDVGIIPYKRTVHFVGGGAFDAPSGASIDRVNRVIPRLAMQAVGIRLQGYFGLPRA